MPGRRPMGPVYRPDPEGEPVSTTETDYLNTRWQRMQNGADLAAKLTVAANLPGATVNDLAATVDALPVPQLRDAALAMVLILATDDEPRRG